MEDKKKLFVGSLSYEARDNDLVEAFSKAGPVASAQVIMDKFSGRSKGFGFVEMETEEGAQAAIEMYNEQEFMGRTIFVNVARPRTERPPRD